MNKIQTQKRGSINCREISMNHLRTRKGGSSSFFWRSDLENKHHKLCNVIAKYNSILKRLLWSNPQQCFFEDEETKIKYYPVFIILLADKSKNEKLAEKIKTEKIDLKLIKTIDYEYITLIPIDKIQTIENNAISELTKKQIPWFTEAQIKAFNEDQIKAFTDKQISWFTENQIQAFTTDQISWFTENQRNIISQKRIKTSSVSNTNTITNNNSKNYLTLKNIDKYRLKRVYNQLIRLIDSYNQLVKDYDQDKNNKNNKKYYEIDKYDDQPMTFKTNNKVTSRKLILAMSVGFLLYIGLNVFSIVNGGPSSGSGFSVTNDEKDFQQNPQYKSCNFHTKINNEDNLNFF